MMTILRHITTAAAGMVMLALAVSACSSDAYDTGDGSLSYMRADFVKAFADHDGKFTAAITDDDLSLTLQPTIAAGWSAPDTVCRALLYMMPPGCLNLPLRLLCAPWRLAGC